MHKKLIVYYFRDIAAAVPPGINFLQIYYLALYKFKQKATVSCDLEYYARRNIIL